jgi:hypothetical protein
MISRVRFIYKIYAYCLSGDLGLYTNSVDKEAKSGLNPKEIKITLSGSKRASIATRRV